MTSRLLGALLACGLICGYVFLPAEGQEKPKQEKPKEVIPHAQSKPPGPALTPEQAVKAMTVPPGFTVELVASEPDLVNPVAMHIDEKGRFWVTESLEYPRRSPGPGQDRVKVIELGPDGKAKKVTIVIEGLNIPSGIAVGHGGVWLANAPDLLYYPIEDFDNLKLGKPQVVVTGFGRADTHELPNSLTWGPDGFLYGLNGVFNPSVIKQDDKEWKFTAALFRIHPRTKKFDLFCEGTSNPWGVTFNDNGDAFISACVIDHLWHLTQTGYYHRQGGPYPPFTWKIESIVKHKHQARAYCGIVWFDSDAYPEEYRKKLYMGNIHGGCINVDEVKRDGSTYAGKPAFVGANKKFGVGEGDDFLVANDAWFMPVVQKVGPDGCLYILDWYDRYHCYQDANRDPKGIDRLKGRLYRVRYKDTPRATDFDITKKTDNELVGMLGSQNVFIREMAQRNLVERRLSIAEKKNDELPFTLLIGTANEKNSQAARMHSFWTLAGLDFPVNFKIDVLPFVGFLSSPNPTIRAWALRSLPALAAKQPEILEHFDAPKQLERLSKDSSPEVQLQVAIASCNVKGVDPLPILLSVLNSCGNDKLIPHIVWQNLHPLLEERSDAFLKEVAKLDPEKAANVYNLMPRAVERILAAKKQDPQALVSLVAMLSGSQNSRETCAKVLGLLNAKVQTGELAGGQLQALEGRLLPAVRKLQNNSNLALALEATLLGAAFKDEESLQSARDLFKSAKQPEAIRLKALDSLIAAGDSGVLATVKSLLDDRASATPAFRGAMFASLGKIDDPKVAGLVLAHYKELEPDVQPRAIELLTQRANWSKELLESVAAKKIPAGALNVNQVRKLLAVKDTAVTKQVEAIWGTIREGRSPEREKLVSEMRDLIKKTPGDPHKGVVVYKKLCAQCHKFHGEGAEVGPDITGNGRSDFEQLLSNVFDPSLVIGLGYRQTNVITTRGQVINGLLVEDSPQRIVLKTQGGKLETIARADVEEKMTIQQSYMPEGIERQLMPQEIADLFAFLVLDRPPSDPAARKIPGTPR